MNKTINTAVFLLMMYPAFAQTGIGSMVKAEKDFAAFSVAHSTKEAFLQYIDSNSIMFDNGIPVKAIEFWNKREKNSGVLNWYPQFAEISASGDFGYTTGPWTYNNKGNDTVIARGQYATVWKLNEKGEWKFLVDLGIDNVQVNNGPERIITVQKERELYTGNLHPLRAAENDFNNTYTKNRSKSYMKWLSAESILLRNGALPASAAGERKVLIDSTPPNLAFATKGMGVSSAQDMGYTYGSVNVKGKPENYFRIWRREKTGWKIAVDLFRY